MSSIRYSSPLEHPQMHSPSLSLCPGQGTVSQEKKYKSVIQAPDSISCVTATGSPLCQSRVVLSPPSSPKPCDSLLGMAAAPGFKSQRQSSSAAPFPTPPMISYTCQHSHILPALLGCHSKSGQEWPNGVEPIMSKLSLMCYNQGELPPSYIMS